MPESRRTGYVSEHSPASPRPATKIGWTDKKRFFSQRLAAKGLGTVPSEYRTAPRSDKSLLLAELPQKRRPPTRARSLESQSTPPGAGAAPGRQAGPAPPVPRGREAGGATKRRSKRDGVSFTQRHRLERLRELLVRDAQGSSLEELATRLGVTTRTLRRYLKELDREYDVIASSPKPGRPRLWRIAASELPKKVEVRRGQAYALVATRGLFQSLQGAALFDEVELVMSRLEALAKRPGRGPNAGFSGPALERRFAYVPTFRRDYSGWSEAVDELFLAVSELHPVHARLHSGGTWRRVTLHPCGLVLSEDRIFVVGLEPPATTPSAIALESLTDVRVIAGQHFRLPDDFSVTRACLSELNKNEEMEMVVDFDAMLMPDLASLSLGSAQRLIRLPDGSLRLSTRVSNSERLLRWILSFGASARVREPDHLVRAVRAQLVGSLTAYEAPSAE